MCLENEIKNDEELIDFLFDTFFGLFPETCCLFKTQEAINLAKSAWLLALFYAKIISSTSINFPLIQKGVTALPYLNQTYMPSCGQFIHLCLHGQESKDDQTMVLS